MGLCNFITLFAILRVSEKFERALPVFIYVHGTHNVFFKAVVSYFVAWAILGIHYYEISLACGFDRNLLKLYTEARLFSLTATYHSLCNSSQSIR